MRVNPHKPLALEGPNLKVTLIGVLPSGNIVVHVESWEEAATFEADTGRGVGRWARVYLKNVPEITSGFYGWSRGQVGRGRTAADFVWDDCPNTKFCLEVEYTDGIPTGAKFHERPMK